MLKAVGGFVVLFAVAVTIFYHQLVLNPIDFQPIDLNGKVVIVTGGTSGIGLESVRKFVEWNATVILPVRNIPKGELVKKHLLSTPVSHTGTIELMEMDLTSFSSVRKFAKEFLAKDLHLDILVLNAGVQSDSPTPLVSDDGVELVYQVNHLSHFLLTRLLLPSLSHTPSRIVHVSSSMHYMGHLDHIAYSPDSRNVKTSRLSTSSYCDTKLMNVIFSNALQDKLTRSQLPQFAHLTSVSVHPGLVLSELDRGLSFGSYLKQVREVIARPTADGAVAQVTIATLPEIIKRGGGLYYEDHCIMSQCTESVLSFINPVYERGGVTPHSAALNSTEQEWLWNTSSEIVGLPREL